MTQMAAKKCFEAAGLRPGDVDVVELHDCFSANELITYEALGLCAEGENAARPSPSSTCSLGWRRSLRRRQPLTSPHLSTSVSLNHQFQFLIGLQ